MAEFSRKQQDAAYRAAEQAIEKALAEAATELILSAIRVDHSGLDPRSIETGFAALTRLPAQIGTLTGLKTLRLEGTQISNLAPLAALIGLQDLSLSETKISDLAPIAALSGLQTLSLDQTKVSDIAPLAALSGLQTLSLDRTQVIDIAPLAALTSLRSVSLTATQVSELPPLAALTGLEELTLHRTQVSDLTSLSALTGLRTIWLDRTQVKDLAPLAAMTGLRTLSLTETQVSDLRPLAALRSMLNLWLDMTQVSDVAPLANLTNLHRLALDGTQVGDIAPLAALTSLTELSLTDSWVRDLRPLLALKKLGTGSPPGLVFVDTPATRADPVLHDLSQIENVEERAEKTLAYLAALPPWPEPLDRAEPPLTVEALIAAQDLAGWRFSPAGSALSLYVRDIPVDQQKSQLARMATDRCGKLMSSLGGRVNSGGFRQAVHDEARTFADILARTDSSLAERSLELWGSLIALGDLLEQNDLARRDGRDPLDLLPPEARAALGTFIASAANLVRSFPEARALDDEHGGFARRRATRQVVVDIVTEALRAALVSPESARLINQVAGVSDSQSRQGDKAAAVSVMGLRNLLMVTTLVGSTVGGIAGGVLEDVGGDISDHYRLGEKALDFLVGAEDKLDALLDAMPTDERARLKGALDDLRPELDQARRRDGKPPQDLKKP